jgi:DNA-binding CsgD family transcriptional regulator
VGRIWREVAAGQWVTLTGVDAGGLRHAVMRRDSTRLLDWSLLSKVQRDVLTLTANDLPQKVIAMKLGLAPSTVSGALQIACKRLGFRSLGQLIRAYCAFMDIIELEESDATVISPLTAKGVRLPSFSPDEPTPLSLQTPTDSRASAGPDSTSQRTHRTPKGVRAGPGCT